MNKPHSYTIQIIIRDPDKARFKVSMPGILRRDIIKPSYDHGIQTCVKQFEEFLGLDTSDFPKTEDISELKPCPFCGGEAEKLTDDDNRWRQIRCKSCGARSDEIPYEDDAKLTMWWNRRELERARTALNPDLVEHATDAAEDAKYGFIKEDSK